MGSPIHQPTQSWASNWDVQQMVFQRRSDLRFKPFISKGGLEKCRSLWFFTIDRLPNRLVPFSAKCCRNHGFYHHMCVNRGSFCSVSMFFSPESVIDHVWHIIVHVWPEISHAWKEVLDMIPPCYPPVSPNEATENPPFISMIFAAYKQTSTSMFIEIFPSDFEKTGR